MRNILFIGGRYYPKASPNSICIRNIIDELPKDKFHVHILCYRDGLDTDASTPTTKVSRGFVQSALYRLEEKGSKLARSLSCFFRTFVKTKQLLFYYQWPWCDPIVTLREIKAAEQLYRQGIYDTIVAVHMPLSSLITASVMKKRHPEVQYIAYFLDALSGGTVPRYMKESTSNRKAIQWEKRVLKNADKIIFMESSRGFHENVYKSTEYASKIHYLDLPILIKREIISEEAKGVLFVYVGTLPPSVRSPEFFLKVFSSISDPNWRVLFVGDEACSLLNNYASKDSRITVIGRCTHEQALRYENRATVLLNFGNKNANLTPSKVFEYMSFGKKIVSTFPIDDEASIKYLKRYSNALLLDERGDINNAAALLRNFVKEEIKLADYAELKRTFFANTPDAFASVINT